MIQLSQLAVCFLLFAFSELAFSEQLTMSDSTTNNSISHKKIKYEDLKFSYGDDRDDLVNSLISGCPFFKGDTLLYEYISEPLYDQDLLVKVPLPGNIKQNFLPKSKKISLIISGSSSGVNGTYSKIQKLVCLNHLAYAYSRGVPAYRFLNTDSFEEELKHLSPHWLKVAALRYYLPQIEADEWMMWIDDDVITSDFRQAVPVTDDIIDFMVKPQDAKSPSIILTQDPNTSLNTGILFVRNSKEGRDYIEHWWETRIDDIHPSVFAKQGTPYYCAKTGLHYQDHNSCFNDCYDKSELYCPLNSCNSNVEDSLDYSSCLHKRNYDGWKPLRDHDQTALYRMHASPPKSTRLFGNRYSVHSLLYATSHVAKATLQKAYLSCDNDHGDCAAGYMGFNTFINGMELNPDAKAEDPHYDLWVQAPGLGDMPGERLRHLSEWLKKINNFYPTIKQK